jgi:hypothetical protein
MRKFTIAAAAAAALVSTAAIAAVTFDASSGTGFVGKGDVQLALGMNNAQVQNATLNFTYTSTDTTFWTCTRTFTLGNGNTQEIVQVRNNSTTTQGVLSSVARVKNQITGYNLLGYAGGGASISTDGPAVGSCPASPSGFVYDDNAETTSLGGGLSVNGVPLA